MRRLGVLAALLGVAVLLGGAIGLVPAWAATPAAPGPPFPDPEAGRYVYDHAGVFSPATRDRVQAQIQAIRDRTGAEIAVYSQVVPYGITTEEAEEHARALMDQWGVGRRGFDDGLVILFDMDPSLEHGQVQLYAGPGYRATFLSNSERQKIFEEDMLPHLGDGDLDAALLAAMDKIDAERHAGARRRARPGTHDQRRRRAGRDSARVLRARPVGGVELDPLRTRPRLPRRPLDPDARAAAGPDRRRRRARDGRLLLAPHPDDGDARPCEP